MVATSRTLAALPLPRQTTSCFLRLWNVSRRRTDCRVSLRTPLEQMFSSFSAGTLTLSTPVCIIARIAANNSEVPRDQIVDRQQSERRVLTRASH